jgi:hypothetical protein
VTPFRSLVLVPWLWAAVGPAPQATDVLLRVQVRGGTCRPQPLAFWLTGDGREVGGGLVPPDGVSLPASERARGAAFLLVECRGYYLAGVHADASPAGPVILDRAIPPRERGHRDGVHVLVQDADRGTPVARAQVRWVVEGRPGDASSRLTDATGRAVLPLPPGGHVPSLIVADAAEQGLQVTAQRYRLDLDDYTLMVRQAPR